MTKLAIFDCDGTMVDSQANICRAMEIAFGKLGIEPPDHHRIRHMVGLSLLETMRALIPDAREETHSKAASLYRDAFVELRQGGRIHEPLYDGLSDLLDRLEHSGWLLAVATGKSDRGLSHMLAAHGLSGRFISLQTADRHPSKPHPSMIHAALSDSGCRPEDTYMIGDTAYDIVMASNAQVLGVGVDWGYHHADDLNSAGAVTVAKTMDELGDFLLEQESRA